MDFPVLEVRARRLGDLQGTSINNIPLPDAGLCVVFKQNRWSLHKELNYRSD